MISFISKAFADDTVTQAANVDPNSGLMGFLPLILIFLVFYFLLIRPQMKKQKEHMAMVNSITRGERVIFAGGLIGTITKIEDDNIIEIEISGNVKVKALKSSIVDILEKNKKDKAPAKEAKKELGAEGA